MQGEESPLIGGSAQEMCGNLNQRKAEAVILAVLIEVHLENLD